MNLSFESKYSSLFEGFDKNHSTQTALLKMIGKWKQGLDKCKKIGNIFMDILKAFDAPN